MKGKKRSRLFETRYFGLLIGLFVILLFTLLRVYTRIPERLELRVVDLHFNLKNVFRARTIQEGVTIEARNPRISPDILIIGIDFNSLNQFGKWPFPRYRHADLIDVFTRIQDQGQRERALFLDIFFIEPDRRAFDDALMVESMRENGRVFLETVLDINPPPAGSESEMFARQAALYEGIGELTNIRGDTGLVPPHLGLQPPLIPYGRAARGYGHANFEADFDKVFRRQALVAKSSELIGYVRLDELGPDISLGERERLAWMDVNGIEHAVPRPLTASALSQLRAAMERKAPLRAADDGTGGPEASYHVVRRFRDRFVPSITLALAAEYFNKSLDEIEVVLGSHIRIPSPQYFDVDSQSWVPHRIEVRPAEYAGDGSLLRPAVTREMPEILIPINAAGEMLINFMGVPSVAEPGGHQTFPVRSYAGYAARVSGTDPATWPRTMAVANKILMVGPFAKGVGSDEKPTPFGLMYGVEMHANALNTILMNNFLVTAPFWLDFAILATGILLVAFMSSRLSTILSLVITIFIVFGYFLATSIIFDHWSFIVNFSTPALGMMFVFLSVIVYRIMTEERDKRRIRDMFGKYVSPTVVDQILANPPELGGVDKELTVFFSDIRGFTTLSESMTPQELVNHLNLYLTAMTDIILDHNGTLDKYVGDEIMCFWGAPLPQSDHALLACRCALRQIEVLGELNASWPPEKRISIGIGINSGIMTVGNMGSLGRMNYTLMGDNVNLAARLEGTNKEYRTTIIISEYTYGLVKDWVIARELDNIRVKGKSRPVVIYELLDVVHGWEQNRRTSAREVAAPIGRRIEERGGP